MVQLAADKNYWITSSIFTVRNACWITERNRPWKRLERCCCRISVNGLPRRQNRWHTWASYRCPRVVMMEIDRFQIAGTFVLFIQAVIDADQQRNLQVQGLGGDQERNYHELFVRTEHR